MCIEFNEITIHLFYFFQNGIVIEFENEAILSEVKNVRIPGVKIDLPTLSEEGKEIDFLLIFTPIFRWGVYNWIRIRDGSRFYFSIFCKKRRRYWIC